MTNLNEKKAADDFLPMSKKAMKRRGWSRCDFVFVIGDAYVDHSSFGPAIISRHLEANGYKVGIISQPDWKDDASITKLGEPRLAFLVCAGNMDSMVNHYTVAKKRRKTDAYTPGGVMGKRPDYATVVYSNLIRRTYKHTPIILGGIEASLRRLAHYDYWSDKVKRSILLDSGADMISYGMGEHSMLEIAEALEADPITKLKMKSQTTAEPQKLKMKPKEEPKEESKPQAFAGKSAVTEDEEDEVIVGEIEEGVKRNHVLKI